MASNLDALRKLLVTGIGTALMTEDSLLKYLSELKLPREAKNYVLAQAQKGKEELARAVSTELGRHIAKMDIQEEIRKALHGMKIHLKATVHFEKGGPSVEVTHTSSDKTPGPKRTTSSKKIN